MASYHLSVKAISRSAGRSATAAAAYRSGTKIVDQRTGEIHDYRRRSGVESVDLIVPSDAPAWASDRERLWSEVEIAETRKNSTVAREFEIALPDELTQDERRRLAVDFGRELMERHGCAVDVAVHSPGQGDDRNHHAHILMSTRRLGADGFTEKTRELDDRQTGPDLVTAWRKRFADMQNERLAAAGRSARVDHRSLRARRIDREPQVHLGPTAAAIERRGVQSIRGNIWRRIIEINRELELLEQQIAALVKDFKNAIFGDFSPEPALAPSGGIGSFQRPHIDPAKRPPDQEKATEDPTPTRPPPRRRRGR